MPSTTCFTEEQLKAFALGQLSDDQSDLLAEHLAECPVCEETVAEFDDTADSVLLNVRGAAARQAADPPSDALQQAMENLAPLTPDSATGVPALVHDWVRDYQLLEQLGSGGMGTVYKAVHHKLQRTVALKVLPARRLRLSEAVGRFEREMQAIGRLNHPAIVRATDAGEVAGTHFLAMDYVHGIDLSQLVKLTGPLRVADASEIVRQTSLGLQYAHDQGLIHRDVKPSNIMLEVSPTDGSVTVKLLDLGLALFGSASEAVDDFTTVGQLMGTLDYMAPEQADNSHGVGATADVYSLGATLFKLLTGTAPFETAEFKTPLRKMKALATVEAPKIRSREQHVPEGVAAIVDQMLLTDPAQRIQTAKSVADAVAPFADGHDLKTITILSMKRASEAKQESDNAIAPQLPTEKPPSVGDRSPSIPPVTAADGSAKPPGRTRKGMRWAAWGLPMAVILGAVFWLVTDTGTLRIECMEDDVPITIRQGEEVVRELTLKTGENIVRLRSGRHEVTIPVQFENLQVEGGSIEIQRGGVSMVRISSSENPVGPATSFRNPVGDSVTPMPPERGEAFVPAALRATVCIRVEEGKEREFGSGSGIIIRSVPGESLVLTVAHLFRDVGDQGVVVVEVFDFNAEGVRTQLAAEVLLADSEADIAVLKVYVPNGELLPFVSVAGGVSFNSQDPVFSTGCAGGSTPRRESRRVLSVNRYQGPENIECTGNPMLGDSGGALFTQYGQLIGICSAADRKEQTGLYTGMTPVLEMLKKIDSDAHVSSTVKPLTSSAKPQRPVFDQATYRLGPGDLLGIRIPDLIGTKSTAIDSHRDSQLPTVTGHPFLVLDNGHISIAFGSIKVEGLTIAEAKAEIRKWYTSRDILHPDFVLSVELVERRTAETERFVRDYRIAANDTLGIYVTDVWRTKTAEAPVPAVHLPANLSLPPAMGESLTVDTDGNIDLQILGQLNLGGKTLSEARQAIIDAYVKAQIFREDMRPVHVSVMNTSQLQFDIANNLNLPERPSPQPLFDGRTFDQWREVSQIERSPAQLEKAVEALATLGENSRDAEAADVILEIASRYPCDPNPPTPEGLLTVAVIRSLRRLSPDATVPVFTKALSKPACSLHELVVGWLCSDVAGFGGGFGVATGQEAVTLGLPAPLLSAFQASAEFRSAVANNWEKFPIAAAQVPESSKRIHTHAVSNAYRLLTLNWEATEPEPFVMDWLRKIVDAEVEYVSAHDDVHSRQHLIARAAAMILATYEPRETLADCFPAKTLTVQPGDAVYVDEPQSNLFLPYDPTNWKTLSMLYGKNSVSVPKEIAKIKELLARNQKTDKVVIPFQEWDGEDGVNVGYHVNLRILTIDLLGQLGHDSPEIREILAREFQTLLKDSPSEDGDFALSSAWKFSFAGSADNTPAPLKGLSAFGGGGFGSGQEPLKAVVDGNTVLLNTTLLAWEKITGAPAKFANYSALRAYLHVAAGHTAKPPILVGYKGKSFPELADVSTLDFDSPDDIQERLLILADDLADPKLKRQNKKSIQEIEARILIGQSFDEQHIQLMRSILSGTEFTEQHDAALAKALQQATPGHREILLGAVIADRAILEISHFNLMVAGPVKSPTPTHLSVNRSRYPRRPSPKTDAEFAKLLNDFEELPAAQQAALLTIVDSIINPLPFSGNNLPAEAADVHPLGHAAVECLTNICRQENDANKLEAAFILAPRIKLKQDDQTLVQDILMNAASLRSPRLDCINAIVRLPAAFNGEFSEAAALTIANLIVSDFEKDFEEEFTVIVPATIDARVGGGNRAIPLPLSRRALLAEALTAAVPEARVLREKIALKLSSAITTETTRMSDDFVVQDAPRYYNALSKYRVVDLEVNNSKSATVAHQMLNRLMQALLGEQWVIALNKLKGE